MIEEEVADFKEKLERLKNLPNPNPTFKPRPLNQPKKNDLSDEEDEDVQENDPVNEGLENFQNLYNVNPTSESSPHNHIKESHCAEESDEPERPPTKPARHDELFGKAFSFSK
ncbi:Oidioi.mRNA.OKI2018_I69.chr2.g7844.t1.cds [Oikopleura dioica]|uniref:Oidioi.mRNA.OKI2018_I69.chr2.g7844.t1.cds n=1 Tax=Oikopleura dioica TaxID=34765 RepID=A0ABN7T8I5_OIKDI|nr:Oidioi.mRNA.OKI2018_I69.chr2.g7844.t1.cds [Oikopleura dioica]